MLFPARILRPTLVALGTVITACSDAPVAPRITPLAVQPLRTHTVGTWTARTAMPTARMGTASAAVNGVIYVLGGHANPNTCSFEKTNEAYDPSTNAWSARAPMPLQRTNFAAAEFNGRIYVAGGNTGCGPTTAMLHVYDPSTNTWSAAASMLRARSHFSLTRVGNVLLAVGGSDDASVEAYDPALNTWQPRTPLPGPRSAHTAAAVGGRVYVIGGYSLTSNLTSVAVYDAATDTWAPGSIAPRDFVYSASAVLNGRVHVVGGFHHAEHHSLDPAAGTWHGELSMSASRGALSAAAVANSMYAIGGYNAPTNSILGTVEAFTFTATSPSDRNDCQGDGWRTFGFKSPGECVRYVETQGVPRRYRVCPGDRSRDTYETVQEAVVAANPGAVILLCDGIHQAAARIAKPLTIRSERRGGATLRDTLDWSASQPIPNAGGPAPVFTVDGLASGTFRVVDVKFQLRQSALLATGTWDRIEMDSVQIISTDSAHTTAVRAFASSVAGAQLQFQRSSMSGVATGVLAAGGTVNVSNAAFDRAGQAVLYTVVRAAPLTAAQGRVESSTFTSCNLPGCVRMTGRGGVVVEGNTFSKAAGDRQGAAVQIHTTFFPENVSHLPIRIENNTFTGVLSPPPATPSSWVLIRAVQILTNNVAVLPSHITVAANRFKDVGSAVHVTSANGTVVDAHDNAVEGGFAGLYWSANHPTITGTWVNNANVYFRRNNVVGTSGSFGADDPHAPGTLDVTCNWWGSTAGPVRPAWRGSASAYTPWAMEPIAGKPGVSCP